MPEREEAGTVRSVERALAILDLLGQHQALGLEELHYLTELPKATVSRLLHTLLEQGWLYRGLTDRRYRLRSTRLYGDAAERFRCQVVERSAPLLVELSERTEGHWEYPVRLPFLIRAVALPVRAQGRLLGSVALHWPRDQDCVERVRRRHLGTLADTVSQLQHALD